MIRLVSRILSWTLNLIPRDRRLLVFSSFPDYTDNSYAFYKYIVATYPGKYNCVWIFSDKESNQIYKGLKGFYKWSLRALWYFARAKFVFCTHGLYSFVSFRKSDKIVNLWHGMPLKMIGSMDRSGDGYNPTKADYLIATSPFFRDIMSESFNNLDKGKIFVVGQPRNDMLFESTDFFVNRNIDISEYTSIGMWLPTYRKAVVGDVRVDGIACEGCVSLLTMDDLEELDYYLRELSAMLIIKLHPMDALQNMEFRSFHNIIVLKQNDMHEQLYPLLGNSDYLLTDFSSVWIDYCILGKPIGFVMNDVEEYKKSRGLTIEELDKKLPGRIISTVGELKQFIRDLPTSGEVYSDMYNVYHDNNSSKRLAEVMNL